VKARASLTTALPLDRNRTMRLRMQPIRIAINLSILAPRAQLRLIETNRNIRVPKALQQPTAINHSIPVHKGRPPALPQLIATSLSIQALRAQLPEQLQRIATNPSIPAPREPQQGQPSRIASSRS
jgi:hypothetical protein